MAFSTISLQELQKETRFAMSELQVLYTHFVRKGEALDRKQFSEVLNVIGIVDPKAQQRYWDVFDADGSGSIDFKEFASKISVLMRGSTEEKYRFTFDIWDEDNDNALSKKEFENFLRGISTRSISKEMIDSIFQDIDTNGDQTISFEEFKKGIAKHQMVLPELYFDPLEATGEITDHLTKGEQEVLSLLGDHITTPAGSPILYRSSQNESCFYILLKGEVEVLVNDTNVVVDLLKKRSTPFGVSSLFAKEADFCSFHAKTAVNSLRVRVDEFLQLLYHDHPGAVTLMSTLGRTMMEQLKVFEGELLTKNTKVQKELGERAAASVAKFVDNRNFISAEWSLRYHSIGVKGKLSILPTKNVGTASDLSVAYSPGVAQPCLAIKNDPKTAFDYTSKGHLVGVISNGTAVLGLGNIGALASKPVMEGKAVLFKKFADLDSFDIEIDESDPDKLIDIVVSLEPTFGGINLEDIGAPHCFRIEKEVQKRMKIPIMHDDQHGTAIVAGAGLLNGLEIIKKRIEDIKVVVSGCGAAGFTCAKYFLSLGVQRKNLIALDVRGVVHKNREDLVADRSLYLNEVACEDDGRRTLSEVIEGADVFLGVSVGNLLKPDMLLKMNSNPLVFALANPTPEINYHLAKQTRDDAILATGRSDFPNQINNVCAFPFIFRGAMDVRATEINQKMKEAATKAIALLAKQAHPSVEWTFGREYLLPKPFDRRLFVEVSAGVAQAAMECGVASRPVDLQEYRDFLLTKF